MSARTHEIPPQIVAIATAAAILQEINAILDAAGIPDLVGDETPADRVRKLAAQAPVDGLHSETYDRMEHALAEALGDPCLCIGSGWDGLLFVVRRLVAEAKQRKAAMKPAPETAALLEVLRDLHGDDVLSEVYAFAAEAECAQGLPLLEAAVYAWAAAGYPDASIG